ncbi:uncharacterized protein BXZ73DRAFT_103104 [Epithele typhae]|uniref:uncharacterized protein n=1 Tax=Epithele typhae TaxID=378194 RepID=UPI002008E545|nr:uncharacterized protein BXZ73DRAFT_103104 [Epithele typhae]KAH9925938.1 hypothetical protein BXZ73DRAFT_103104 [Epithele typhae]
MGDLGADSVLASEFVTFLHAQLKASRDEVERLKQENTSLQAELHEVRQALEPDKSEHIAGDDSTVAKLQSDLEILRQEVQDMCALAAVHEADAKTWKTRYEELKPQLLASAAGNTAILDKMRDQLANFVTCQPHVTNDKTAEEFIAFLSVLPGAFCSDIRGKTAQALFHSTYLPLLPKSAIDACVAGGYAFFGPNLFWCGPLSQHAYVVHPCLKYNPKFANGETQWSLDSRWSQMMGQQRDLFYLHNGSVCYAGTFICHSGPRSVSLSHMTSVNANEQFATTLARGTFDAMNVNQKAKGKVYIPLLDTLYRDGSLSVQLLGLQRVGFNEKLYHILKKASDKRVMFRTTDNSRAAPTTKRTMEDMQQGTNDAVMEQWDEEAGPSPPKLPRLQHGVTVAELPGDNYA